MLNYEYNIQGMFGQFYESGIVGVANKINYILIFFCSMNALIISRRYVN